MRTIEKSVQEWDFDPKEILASPRKVQGIFHQPVVDKDGELITPEGMRNAVPDFMHLPALHDFHKERPVGLATKIKELSGGRFFFEGVIKATSDCDDIWEKVKTGNYDQVSIFGKRTKYNNQCSMPQNMRSGTCVTDGVRLDSISVCDENARNPQTSLEVKKARTVLDADTIGKQWGRNDEGIFGEIKKAEYPAPRAKEKPPGKFDSMGRNFKPKPKDEEKKAETAEGSNLMHTSTDHADKKGYKINVKGEVIRTDTKSRATCPQHERADIGKCPVCKKEEPNTISKDVEKGEKKKRKVSEAEIERNIARSQDQWEQQRENPRDFGYINKGEDVEEHPPTGEKGSPHKVGAVGEPRKKEPAPKGRYDPGTPRVPPQTFPPKTKARGGNPDTERKPGEASRNTHPAGHKPIGVKFSGTRYKEGEGRKPGSIKEPMTTVGVEYGHPGASVGSDKLIPPGKDEPAPERTAKQKSAGKKLVPRSEKMANYPEGKEPIKEMTREQRLAWGKKNARRKSAVQYEHWTDPKSEVTEGYKKGDDEGDAMSEQDVEKSAAEELKNESYEEDEDKDVKRAKPTDKEGRWNKKGDPNGTVKMSKAKEDDEPEEEPKKQKKGKPSEEDEQEEVQEEAYEEEEEDVEKGNTHGVGYGTHRGKMPAKVHGHSGSEQRESRKQERRQEAGIADYRKESAMAGLKNMQKAKGDEEQSESFNPSTVSKGEPMEEHEVEDVEYVTKALVPIEEIDTIVKARTEEISKAYVAQLDEIKKAYDAKFVELTSKVEKMEQETIRKGGNVVVIPELMGYDSTSSNADALARMQAGRS